eukprot:830058-Rhodomonas_salina.1
MEKADKVSEGFSGSSSGQTSDTVGGLKQSPTVQPSSNGSGRTVLVFNEREGRTRSDLEQVILDVSNPASPFANADVVGAGVNQMMLLGRANMLWHNGGSGKQLVHRSGSGRDVMRPRMMDVEATLVQVSRKGKEMPIFADPGL